MARLLGADSVLRGKKPQTFVPVTFFVTIKRPVS